MQQDFEGRTEQEAIDRAIRELGLDRDQFDVEILGKEKKSFLSRMKRRFMRKAADRQATRA